MKRIPRATNGMKPGRSKSGGRQKGTPNKATQHMRNMMEMAAAACGYDGKGSGGAMGWLIRQCEEHPKFFLETWARLEPRLLTAAIDNRLAIDVTYETVEEAKDALAKEGLVIDHVLQ